MPGVCDLALGSFSDGAACSFWFELRRKKAPECEEMVAELRRELQVAVFQAILFYNDFMAISVPKSI